MMNAHLGLLIAVSTLLATAGPALGGERGTIAFDSDRDGGDIDVWTMRPDGGGLANLTANSPATDGLSNWRPDGRRIAFMSERITATNPEGDFEIFVMRADGSHQRQITSNALDDEHPSWSSDGRRIAFQRDFDPVRGQVDYDILTMRADGSHEHNLTNSPAVQDVEPDWSLAGRRIVFNSDRDGDEEIHTIEASGAGLRQLTFNDAADGQPSWSPDGRQIAFHSDRDGDFEIFAMRADGSRQHNLTNAPLGEDFGPSWSPDGRMISFDRFDPVADDVDVYTMRANGTAQTNRTANPGFDAFSDWGPGA